MKSLKINLSLSQTNDTIRLCRLRSYRVTCWIWRHFAYQARMTSISFKLRVWYKMIISCFIHNVNVQKFTRSFEIDINYLNFKPSWKRSANVRFRSTHTHTYEHDHKIKRWSEMKNSCVIALWVKCISLDREYTRLIVTLYILEHTTHIVRNHKCVYTLMKMEF